MGKEDQDEKPPADNSMMLKAVAGVFAMVVAPVLVAFGMKFSDVLVAGAGSKTDGAGGAANAPDNSGGKGTRKKGKAAGYETAGRKRTARASERLVAQRPGDKMASA